MFLFGPSPEKRQSRLSQTSLPTRKIILSLTWCSHCFEAIQVRSQPWHHYRSNRQQSPQKNWKGLLKKDLQSLWLNFSWVCQKSYKVLWVKLFQNHADWWPSSRANKNAKRHGEWRLWPALLAPTLRTVEIYSHRKPFKSFRRLGLWRRRTLFITNSNQRSKTWNSWWSN